MTHEEIEQLTDKIYAAVKNIPLVDRVFVGKCLQGINTLGDLDVEHKIKLLARLL